MLMWPNMIFIYLKRWADLFKTLVIWDITLYSLLGRCRCFGGTCYICVQRRISFCMNPKVVLVTTSTPLAEASHCVE